MQPNISLAFETILMISISILWCEIGYYYFTFYFKCTSWPGPDEQTSIRPNSQNLSKLLVIADTHIMGPIKSVRFDKLRREWQMKQSFRISNSIFKPDVLVFLGDILDEGSFSRDQYFDEACNDFDEIFAYHEQSQERIIIPGNHDVGFHDRMIYYPFLLERFRARYATTSTIELVQTPKTKHLNLIVSNSMSFYNDTCPFCSYSMANLNRLELYLSSDKNAKNRGAPILLGHIPLFRLNDLHCEHPSSLLNKVSEDNVEGKDVLHKVSSSEILSKLKPRLALSGHTHMLCRTTHQVPGDERNKFRELTVSSYNHKYAELRPGFLLMAANSTHVYTKHCNLIDEWVVVSVYVATLFTVLFRILSAFKNRSNDGIILHDELATDSS